LHTIAIVSSVTTEKIASIRSPFVATRCRRRLLPSRARAL
jgi:hypothetical protein